MRNLSVGDLRSSWQIVFEVTTGLWGKGIPVGRRRKVIVFCQSLEQIVGLGRVDYFEEETDTEIIICRSIRHFLESPDLQALFSDELIHYIHSSFSRVLQRRNNFLSKELLLLHIDNCKTETPELLVTALCDIATIISFLKYSADFQNYCVVADVYTKYLAKDADLIYGSLLLDKMKDEARALIEDKKLDNITYGERDNLIIELTKSVNSRWT